MKFPITKAEFLAWCRENGGKRVTNWDNHECLMGSCVGYDAWTQGTIPKWSNRIATAFDGLGPTAHRRTMTVRTALRELAEAGVPGFTKKELREAAGL